MKNRFFTKLLKVVYLSWCLIVAFTPNKMAKKPSVQVETTHLEKASDQAVEPYRAAFQEFEEKELSKHEGLTSTIVMKDGEVYYENYFNNNNEDSIFEVHSCTKTVIALLTGIAHDQGIGDENSKYIDLFQGLNVNDIAEGIEDVTLEDMLSMSSGINWDEYVNRLSVKASIIKHDLNYGRNLIPSAIMLHKPGTNFKYDSNESRSLMTMVAYQSGMEDIEFAKKYLFDKLEISDFIWPYNDSGLLPGGKDLFLSARDLAKIGQLLLDDGMYKGEQIVSKEWVSKMLTPVMKDVPAEDVIPEDKLDYSYYMWHTTYNGVDVNFAYGRGGQHIFLVPEYNICVVTSAIDKERSDCFRNIAYDVINIFQGVDVNYE